MRVLPHHSSLDEQLEEGLPVQIGGEHPNEVEVGPLFHHCGGPALGEEVFGGLLVVIEDPLEVSLEFQPVLSLGDHSDLASGDFAARMV